MGRLDVRMSSAVGQEKPSRSPSPGYHPDVENQPDILVIAQGKVGELREMLCVLTSGGLEAEIVRPPDTNVNT